MTKQRIEFIWSKFCSVYRFRNDMEIGHYAGYKCVDDFKIVGDQVVLEISEPKYGMGFTGITFPAEWAYMDDFELFEAIANKREEYKLDTTKA